MYNNEVNLIKKLAANKAKCKLVYGTLANYD